MKFRAALLALLVVFPLAHLDTAAGAGSADGTSLRGDVAAYRGTVDAAVAEYVAAHAAYIDDPDRAREGMSNASRAISDMFFEFERGHNDPDSLSVFMQTRMPGSFYSTFERHVVLLRTAMKPPAEGSSPTPLADVQAQANLVQLSFTRAEGCMPDGCRSGPAGVGAEAFLVLLREGFEAILLVGAVVAYLRKSNRADKLRVVYAGVAAALVLTVVSWFALQALFAGAERANLATRGAIEGVTMLLAAGVLFYVSYWLISKVESRRWQQFIDGKVKDSLASDKAWALGAIGFLAVYREGLETALFFQGIWARADGHYASVGWGVLFATVVLAALYYAVFRLGVKIPLRRFFAATSVLLYVLAIRFMGLGLFELQEAGTIVATPLYSVAGALATRPLLSVLTQDLLGFAPTLEVLLGQLVLVALAAGGGAYSWWRARPAHVSGA